MTTSPPRPPARKLRRWKSKRDKRLSLLVTEVVVFLAGIKPDHPAACLCERCEALRAGLGIYRALRGPLTPRR